MHLAVNRNHLPDKGRGQKIEALHAGSNDGRALTMLDGNNRGGLVDHMHDDSSVDVTLSVGIHQGHHASGGAARVGNIVSLTQINFWPILIALHYSLEWTHKTQYSPIQDK